MFGTKILEEKKSKFNGNLRVVKTWGMGTYIQAGGLTQSGGIVESIWRSTLKHVAYSIPHKAPSCLILGLGGGTVAKLIRKNWPGAKITGVEIDPVIIELGKKYLGLNEVAVDIKIQDAGKPVLGNFDLVIVDLYVGDRFPENFESKKFLKSLTGNKVVVFNRLYYKDKKREAQVFEKKLRKVFKKVEVFRPQANIMFLVSQE